MSGIFRISANKLGNSVSNLMRYDMRSDTELMVPGCAITAQNMLPFCVPFPFPVNLDGLIETLLCSRPFGLKEELVMSKKSKSKIAKASEQQLTDKLLSEAKTEIATAEQVLAKADETANQHYRAAA